MSFLRDLFGGPAKDDSRKDAGKKKKNGGEDPERDPLGELLFYETIDDDDD